MSMKTAFGWWKVPSRFLPGGGVHPGFPADAAVHLGQEGRRDLDHGDPPHVDRGRKTGQIADDAAAQGDQGGLPVRAEGGQLFGDGQDAFRSPWTASPGGTAIRSTRRSAFSRAACTRSPWRASIVVVRDDDVPLGPAVPRQDHPHAVQDLLADVDLIGAADLPVEIHLHRCSLKPPDPVAHRVRQEVDLVHEPVELLRPERLGTVRRRPFPAPDGSRR